MVFRLPARLASLIVYNVAYRYNHDQHKAVKSHTDGCYIAILSKIGRPV